MAGEFQNLSYEHPFVVSEGGVRSLHFTYGETQSSMRLDAPDALELDYTRTMMAFALLAPRPSEILMIGLGGGSLLKYCRRHLPQAHITVVEINPGVIALRHEFGIPDDDARLQVLADDGADYIRHAQRPADVLLIDAFDRGGQAPQLCSQDFYDDCRRALAAGGLLVVNLHVDHPEFELHLERIAQSFLGNAVQMLAEDEGNCIVMAGRTRPVQVQALRNARPPAAMADLQREFLRIGWQACALRVAPRVRPATAR